jgi:hypothetical protein
VSAAAEPVDPDAFITVHLIVANTAGAPKSVWKSTGVLPKKDFHTNLEAVKVLAGMLAESLTQQIAREGWSLKKNKPGGRGELE